MNAGVHILVYGRKVLANQQKELMLAASRP